MEKINSEGFEHLKIRMLECEGLHIAGTFETESTDEHPVYHPTNFLIYMIQGQFNMKLDSELHVIPEGSFCLVRKYTHGKCFKTWGKDQDGARMIAFAFQDEFLRGMIQDKLGDVEKYEESKQVVALPPTSLLMGLVNSLKEYFVENKELDRDIVQLKTMEALLAMINADPSIISVFRDFSIPERANIVDFMNYNFMYNMSLENFAQMSGRSLSTFHRDFKSVFNESPHKWIMKQRLQMAKRLIQEGKRASDVYLEVGFEDLAHFSKRFKAFFGINPSEIRPLTI